MGLAKLLLLGLRSRKDGGSQMDPPEFANIRTQ